MKSQLWSDMMSAYLFLDIYGCHFEFQSVLNKFLDFLNKSHVIQPIGIIVLTQTKTGQKFGMGFFGG